jgi:hypothetical protein
MVNPYENHRQYPATSNLIAPKQNFVPKYRVLLKTAGLSVCSGGALDVPVAQSKFSH